MAAVRHSYTDVWAAPTALYACVFLCCCVLMEIVSLQQQGNYRALWEKQAQVYPVWLCIWDDKGTDDR